MSSAEMSETRRPPQLRKRIVEVDVLRGIAVLGVVFSHALDGISNAGLISPGSPLIQANQWLYQFRMPAIALVLGMFVGGGIRKYGAKGYVRRRVVFAAYLYPIWYVIEMLAEFAGNSVKNYPITWQQAVSIWVPPAHLWFIPYIAVAAIVLTACMASRLPQWVWASCLVVLSIALWGFSLDIIGLRGLPLLGFSALGAAMGRHGFARLFLSHKLVTILLGLTALIASAWLASFPITPATSQASAEIRALPWWQWVGNSVLVSYLGLLGLASISVLLAHLPVLCRPLIYLGGKTLEVYLAHVIVVAGARIVLVRLGLVEPGWLLIALTLAGVVAPLLIERILRNTPGYLIFEPPARLLPAPLPVRS